MKLHFFSMCLSEHKADDKPFFGYLSYQAVHAPLAAPDDWLDKYNGQPSPLIHNRLLGSLQALYTSTIDGSHWPDGHRSYLTVSRRT